MQVIMLTIYIRIATFPGLHTQLLSLAVRTAVLQATKAGRGGLGTRLIRIRVRTTRTRGKSRAILFHVPFHSTFHSIPRSIPFHVPCFTVYRPVLYFCFTSMMLVTPPYHVRNNYVAYTVKLLLCTCNCVASLAQLRVRDRC